MNMTTMLFNSKDEPSTKCNSNQGNPGNEDGMAGKNAKDFVIWETGGMIAGGFACVATWLQVAAEWRVKTPSTMSLGFVLGFLAVYAFWALYGLKFRKPALLIANSVLVLLQSALAILAFCK